MEDSLATLLGISIFFVVDLIGFHSKSVKITLFDYILIKGDAFYTLMGLTWPMICVVTCDDDEIGAI